MKLKQQYKTDLEGSENGVWVPIDGQGCALKIARMSNLKYQNRRRELERPHQHLTRTTGIPAELANQIFNQCIAETILVDWQGVEDDEGNEVPYSKEVSYDYIVSMPDFKELVVSLAIDQNTFRQQTLDEDVKNS